MRLHASAIAAYNSSVMPILTPDTVDFISRSASQTRRVGMRLGSYLQPGDVVGLQGDLGSGKTTMVQGIAAGWGSLDVVVSPTFVLVNVYRRLDGNHLFHLDAYRLSGSREAADLDLDAMLEKGPLLVEWAERITAVLPDERLWVHLSWINDSQRDLLIRAQGARYQKMLRDFRRTVFGIT